MNDPQQIRRALTEIRRALDPRSRDELAEILALVFKEYVVEGSQAIASGGQVIDARSDLEGLSFAEVVTWLQTHLDAPELALFEVSGADVSVRVEGRPVRLQARPAAPLPAPTPAPMPVTATPTVRTVPMPGQAPTPTSPPVAAPTPPPAAPAVKEEGTPEPGTRFSLLEVD